MPKFAANLTMLFTEQPFLDRFAAASRAGFNAVEFLFPYDHPAQQVADTAKAAGLQVVLHNLPAGNWDGGERGSACLPDRMDEFRASVARAIEYAEALGLAILDKKDHPNIKLQYDIYHAQVMESDLLPTIGPNLGRVEHMQVADNAGRNEAGTGEINYPYVFRRPDKLGYAGRIGCEYKPSAAGFGWTRPFRAGPRAHSLLEETPQHEQHRLHLAGHHGCWPAMEPSRSRLSQPGCRTRRRKCPNSVRVASRTRIAMIATLQTALDAATGSGAGGGDHSHDPGRRHQGKGIRSRQGYG